MVPVPASTFYLKTCSPFHTGPWGSLVSFVLGVHVTPVQIWAGPLSASLSSGVNMLRFVVSNILTDDAALIRREVFMDEQGFVNEFDETDEVSRHIVAYDGDSPVAVCRITRGGRCVPSRQGRGCVRSSGQVPGIYPPEGSRGAGVRHRSAPHGAGCAGTCQGVLREAGIRCIR